MEKTLEYQGRIYTRRNSKWVDADSLVVPVYLQHILNTLAFSEEDLSELSYEDAKKEGDKYKASESYSLAIRFYEDALKKAGDAPKVSAILPRITSCYRKEGKPRKVIELMAEAKASFGVGILNKALLTSVAAAYCDVGEPENAIKCCRWAYRVLKEENDEYSIQLSSVFARANKMIDPNYSTKEALEEREYEIRNH